MTVDVMDWPEDARLALAEAVFDLTKARQEIKRLQDYIAVMPYPDEIIREHEDRQEKLARDGPAQVSDVEVGEATRRDVEPGEELARGARMAIILRNKAVQRLLDASEAAADALDEVILHEIAQGETPNGYVNEATVLFAESVLRADD